MKVALGCSSWRGRSRTSQAKGSRYTEIKDKEFHFIVAAADTNKQAMERTLEGLRGFTSCLSGAKEKGVIYGTGAWKAGEIKGKPAMKKAYESSKAVR
jgi:hypothetical protein